MTAVDASGLEGNCMCDVKLRASYPRYQLVIDVTQINLLHSARR